jgi:ABC transport system ATP-binding/permease protein
MPLLTLESVSLAHGHVSLLDRVDLALDSGDKVALIGRNGTGKSSLLRIIAGAAAADDGVVWRKPGLRLAHVPQEPQFAPGHTVFEAAAEGLGEAQRLLTEYERVAHALEGGRDVALLARLEDLSAQLESGEGWRLKSRVEMVLSRLHLPGHALVEELSGGQKKRTALARALVLEPELMLLDEPTNHLDIESIQWLEQLLADFAGALLFVTHDRAFLDRVATRVAELDRGRLTSFPGAFSAFQQRKAEQLAQEITVNEKFDKLLAQEEAWIRRGVEARRTREQWRIRRLDELRRQRAQRRERLGNVALAVEEGARSGELVAELSHVTKSFGGKPVVADFTCRILRGDKVGVIGPNGAGKTTLLRLILGELQPDAGAVRRGTRLSVAYYDQFRAQLDEEASVQDTVGQGADYVEVGGERKHVMSYLGDFLFSPERVRSPVKSLSGGERNRLLLARLFTRSANLLVLDEPTNDLDIETLELLEALLQDYGGTVLLVSHDRTFLDNVVTQVIAFDGHGKWLENPGGYQEWARVLRARDESRRAADPERQPAGRAEAARPTRALKLTWKERQELEDLPARIEALEREQGELARQLADPGFYSAEPARVREANSRYQELEALLLTALERWTELEAKGR